MFGIDTRVWSQATLALIEWYKGNAVTARDYSNRAVSWAKALKHLPSLGIALLYRANLLHYSRAIEDVSDTIVDLLEIADRYGLAGYRGYGQILQCWVKGDVSGADAVIAMLQGMGCTAGLSYYSSLSAEIHARNGHWKDAVRVIEQCLELCEENGERYYVPELFRLRGEYSAQLAGTDVERVMGSYRQAAKTAHAAGMIRTEFQALTALCEQEGHREERTRIEEILQFHPDFGGMEGRI
jgi:tetratricopeptide (TPR) repeat protein